VKWEARGAAGASPGLRFYVHPSGFQVRHCGHPTALRPYYVQDPSGWRVGHMSEVTRKGRPMGLVFRLLCDAQAWVDEHVRIRPRMDVETLELSSVWCLLLPADWPFDLPKGEAFPVPDELPGPTVGQLELAW
jgi:hypothetical protein